MLARKLGDAIARPWAGVVLTISYSPLRDLVTVDHKPARPNIWSDVHLQPAPFTQSTQ